MNVIGVGVDIEPVSSFEKRCLSTQAAFYARVFSPHEISYCTRFRQSAPHFTARFCAKEAMVKAARAVCPLHITDVEVDNTKDGAPFFRPRSKKAAVAKFFREHEVFLSLSHTKELATAFVILTKKPKKKERK